MTLLRAPSSLLVVRLPRERCPECLLGSSRPARRLRGSWKDNCVTFLDEHILCTSLLAVPSSPDTLSSSHHQASSGRLSQDTVGSLFSTCADTFDSSTLFALSMVTVM